MSQRFLLLSTENHENAIGIFSQTQGVVLAEFAEHLEWEKWW